MKRLLREPLLHFGLLGAALFALHGWMRPAAAASPDQLVVSAAQVESLALTFARTWQRPPTREELEHLVDDFIEEEVLSREAIALGLDRDDTVIRRRLRQKMEFVAEDLAATAEPSEAELADWLRTHPEPFTVEARTSFRQVYLGEEPGESSGPAVESLLARLKSEGAEADTSALGRPLLLPAAFVLERHGSVAAQLGDEFAAALEHAPLGEWSGPLQSAYGAHLVLVTEREPARQPALDEVREKVRNELIDARRERTSASFLGSLRERYEIRIEWPEALAKASGQ